jgi:60 kDa SS-A/Ro ribonucleoprotein
MSVKGFLGSVHNQPQVNLGGQPTRTREGGRAYTLTLEEKLCHAFTMGFLAGNFYTKEEDVIKLTRDLFNEALKTKEGAEIATKYAVYAAEELGMKFMPTLWLVYVSTLSDKTLFQKAFPRIMGKNVKLVHDFVDLCRNSDIRPGGVHSQKVKKNQNRGLGQGVKKVINNWAYSVADDYNATRFAGKWEDILRLTRPLDKVVTRQKRGQSVEVDLGNLFKYIFQPRDKEGKSLPRRLTFERARVLKDTIEILNDKNRSYEQFQRALNNITAQKLQMDEIKHTFGNLNRNELQAVYMYFVPEMRYAVMVGNLVAIEKAFATRTQRIMKLDPMGSGKYFEQDQVLETNIPKELIAIVAKKLASFEDYKASKMLFFRLLTAHEMTITREWKIALNDVLGKAGKIAFADLPAGRTIRCSADTSGSMSMSNRQISNTLYAVDVAAYLTAAITLSTPNTEAFATASVTQTVPLYSENLVDCAVRIKQAQVGHGTNFESLLDGYKGEDIVILVTDGEQSDNMERKWQSLKNRPANSKLIIWHVANWTTFNKISNDSSVLYLKGYSDSLLNTLANLITGKAGQPEIVRSIKL